jgi:exodeoxyribonuclease VII small subunit
MPSNSKKKSLNFESTLDEIEKIIESLEEGNLSLEDSIKAYEKGMSLTKDCQKMLSDAELKIKKLSSKEGEDVSFEDISND